MTSTKYIAWWRILQTTSANAIKVTDRWNSYKSKQKRSNVQNTNTHHTWTSVTDNSHPSDTYRVNCKSELQNKGHTPVWEARPWPVTPGTCLYHVIGLCCVYNVKSKKQTEIVCGNNKTFLICFYQKTNNI